uniref:hypothetical protein n=1 Tax=Nocardia carnea TaxID=37328 RepID=UPI002454003B
GAPAPAGPRAGAPPPEGPRGLYIGDGPPAPGGRPFISSMPVLVTPAALTLRLLRMEGERAV